MIRQIKIKTKKIVSFSIFAFILLFLFFSNIFADNNSDGPRPPDTITDFYIATHTAEHFFDYVHYKVIGVCIWLDWDPFPDINFTLELDEHLPDLVVSSYNGKGNNPWWEIKNSYDIAAYTAGNVATHNIAGVDLTNGAVKEQNKQGYDSLKTKSVDVIGNPFTLFHFPFLNLRLDTKSYHPYYLSDADILGGRSGAAEALRPETWILGHYIGSSFLHHWGYEFPRSMTINVPNDYKASVIAALHAADIVTNKHTLHVVSETSDSCGTNCSVANVIEEQGDDHEIWEEIYPKDHHIQLGQEDSGTNSLGSEDDKKGNGNYVFLIWRHYKGCMQGKGKLIYKVVNVPPTKKR